MQESDSFLAE